MVDGIDEVWTSDLADLQGWSKFNKGYRYLLTVIDVFSKYGWVVPLKDKKGETVASAFKSIMKSGRKPNRVWVDKGKEFYNKHVKDILDIYSTNNFEKSSVAERFNRSLKERMFKYFTANSTNVYIDVLDGIVETYNNAYHRSIRMTPVEVSLKKNEKQVYKNLYGKELKKGTIVDGERSREDVARSKPKFKLGDFVRIPKQKSVFEKGYTPRWTEEVFQVVQIAYTNPVTYKLKDSSGEQIQGSFYEQELQKTKQQVYRIERVLQKRGKKYLVKWKGYPDSFNSWVDAKDVLSI